MAGDTEFFSQFEEELGGTRPDRMYEVRPQERDQRHTVEQVVDTVLFAPSLDVPVPQMGNQLVDVCRLFDVLIPEQGIKVPKISPTPRPPRRRRVRFAEQTAEQLVEVPTIMSYSFLQRTVEQNVNIPVPGSGGQQVGLHGFLPRQRSTAVHASLERSSERIVEQIVDSRVLGGRFSASSSSSREHAGEGVFRTFPRIKKSPKLGSHSGSELVRTLIHVLRRLMPSPWRALTTSRSQGWSQGRLELHKGRLVRVCAYGDRCTFASTTTGMRGCVWTLRGVRFGGTWTLGTNSGARHGNTEVPQIQFIDYVVLEAELEYIIMRQSTEAFGFVCSFGLLALFALGKRCIILLIPVSGSLSRCLGVACGLQNIGFFGR